MLRSQQKHINQNTIEMVKNLVLLSGRHAPSYEQTSFELNTLGYTTSRGNQWTPKRLFRMLQRSGIRGLHELKQESRQQTGISTPLKGSTLKLP